MRWYPETEIDVVDVKYGAPLVRAGVTIPMVALLLCRCESVNASVLNKLPQTAELLIPCGLNQLEL